MTNAATTRSLDTAGAPDSSTASDSRPSEARSNAVTTYRQNCSGSSSEASRDTHATAFPARLTSSSHPAINVVFPKPAGPETKVRRACIASVSSSRSRGLATTACPTLGTDILVAISAAAIHPRSRARRSSERRTTVTIWPCRQIRQCSSAQDDHRNSQRGPLGAEGGSMGHLGDCASSGTGGYWPASWNRSELSPLRRSGATWTLRGDELSRRIRPRRSCPTDSRPRAAAETAAASARPGARRLQHRVAHERLGAASRAGRSGRHAQPRHEF